MKHHCLCTGLSSGALLRPWPLVDGPTWIEYLADMVGYQLFDNAIGSGVTNRSISTRAVGDFYPSNLLSNKRGTLNVTLPTFGDQISTYLAGNPVSEQDVFVAEIGVNDLLVSGRIFPRVHQCLQCGINF